MKGLLAGVIAIGILALLLPGGGDESKAPRKAKPRPQAAAVATDGYLERSTARDRMPIFSAADLQPGRSSKGTVTIANSGKGDGFFVLSQADLTDLPGPGGGALTERLHLEVQDVTRPSKPVTIYRGPFAAMGARSVGFIPPGDTRKYVVRATATNASPSPEKVAAGVDPYEGSAATVRFVWAAFEGAPSIPGRPVAPSRKIPDRRPPRLRLEIPRVQPLLTRDYLAAVGRCNERCSVNARGTVRAGATGPGTLTSFKGRSARPGKPLRLRFVIPPGQLQALRASLLAGRPVMIRLVLSARDRAGNRSAVKRNVKLNPKPPAKPKPGPAGAAAGR